MRHLTLTEIDATLKTQPASIAGLRDTPGWARVADAYEALAAYRKQLAVWAEGRAEEERNRLRALRFQTAQTLDATTSEVAGRIRALGIEVGDSSLESLESTWPAVLDAVEVAEREARLLGSTDPASRHREALKAKGAIVTEPQQTTAADLAREIRTGFQTATSLQREISKLEQQVNSVDPVEIDAKNTRWLNEWQAIPNHNLPDTRPMLDDWILPTLLRAGIDVESAISNTTAA
jgi:hypothetical protein